MATGLSLILFVFIILIVTALLLYAVSLLPVPTTPPMQWIKPALMVLVVLCMALLILQKAGIAL
jgi:hypothetical protein